MRELEDVIAQYRRPWDEYTERIDNAHSGEAMNRLIAKRRRHSSDIAMARLFEANPNIFVGVLSTGEVLVDMGKADEHPGKWGHRLTEAQAHKLPKGWTLPAPAPAG